MPTMPYSSFFGDAPDAADVAGVKIARQAELGIVGGGDRFFGVERNDGATGPKVSSRMIFMSGDVRQHRWFVEVPAERTLAAGLQLRALGERVGHVLFDLCHCLIVDQRALRNAFIESVADGDLRSTAASFSTNAS